MKMVILAGGRGTRLSEETDSKPKPMVEIGGRPILWHLIKYCGQFDVKHFCVALGYKGNVIKRYFSEYALLGGNLSISLATGVVDCRDRSVEDWVIDLVDTGLETKTGGRVKRLASYLGGERFMLTYGDGLANVDLSALLGFHARHGKLATVTAVRPPARFGGLIFDGDRVREFTEKPQIGEGWINGGFFVFEPGVLDYLAGDDSSLETDGLERLAEDGQLMAFKHEGFWQCVDTMRDLRLLNEHWDHGAPWKVWP